MAPSVAGPRQCRRADYEANLKMVETARKIKGTQDLYDKVLVYTFVMGQHVCIAPTAQGLIQYETKEFPSVRLSFFLRIVLPPLDSEMAWTGEPWSKTYLLKWQK